MLTDIKGKFDDNTIIAGDLNTNNTLVIQTENQYSNNRLKWQNWLVALNRTFHSKTEERYIYIQMEYSPGETKC